MTTYRRALRRRKGPTPREGPPGVLRASYARCGLCQGVETLPFRSSHPRSSCLRWPTGWGWIDPRGAVHLRCASYLGGAPPPRGEGRPARRASGARRGPLGAWDGPPVLLLDRERPWPGAPLPPPELLAVIGTHPRTPRVLRVSPIERQGAVLYPIPDRSRWEPLNILRPPRRRPIP